MAKRQLLHKWGDITQPNAFSNPKYFIKTISKLKRKELGGLKGITQLLEKNSSFQLTRNKKRTFPRRHEYAFYFSEKWEADLADFGKLPKSLAQIDGRYALVIVDIFSKKIFSHALENKLGSSIVLALQNIFRDLKSPYTCPTVLETDSGGEFNNAQVKAFLKKSNIRFVLATGGLRARNAERAIRSFKKLMTQYLEFGAPKKTWQQCVSLVTKSMNQRYHRTIGMSPNKMPYGKNWLNIQTSNIAKEKQSLIPFDDYLVWQKKLQKGQKVEEYGKKYGIGDKVFIPYEERKGALEKERGRPYSYKTYVISQIQTQEKPFLFKLRDLKGKELKRWFYSPELKKATLPYAVPIEKILKSKKEKGRKVHLVRLADHDADYDKWIRADKLKKMKKVGKVKR